ncbi:hypothetical protein AKO1_007606 [Acrasis kona]|uniref:Uncharacterized protein n=1 Tax=Acrasis kona TaxID=1008807 RepID=A0AAW2YRP4_9EUKA
MYKRLIALVLVVAVAWLIHFRNNLLDKVTVMSGNGAPPPGLTDSAPELLENTSDKVILWETASKVVEGIKSNDDKPSPITKYLRYNMRRFTNLPQAYIMKYMVEESAKKTFEYSYLDDLNFSEGDVVCGIYKVVQRSSEKIELSFLPLPNSKGPQIKGRLIISFKDVGDGKTKVSNGLVMWRNKDDNLTLPLERAVGRWLHELMTCWLVDSGSAYVIEQSV